MSGSIPARLRGAMPAQRTLGVRNLFLTFLIAPAKQRQGYDKWTEYANRWTDDNAEASVRAVLKTPPWSRIASSKTPVTAVTKSPAAVSVQAGKEPSPNEIDYSGRGLAAARKAGFKDLGDMILNGQAPLKSGGIRKWR